MQSFAESSFAFDEAESQDLIDGPTIATTVTNRMGNPKPRELNLARKPTIDWHYEENNIQLVSAPTSVEDEGIPSVFTMPPRTNPTEGKIREYLKRVSELRADLAQEGNVLNRESEDDFWLFVVNEFGFRKGSLVVTDDGNLRIVWKDRRGTHLGLQFLGGSEIQYVIFKRRTATQKISRVAGRDTVEGVKNQIDSFALNTLLNE